MKTRTVLSLTMLLNVGLTQADTVIEKVPDTLPGKGFGGLSGLMVGAAIGAGLGWLVVGETQKATGPSGQAYRVARSGLVTR